MIAQLKRIYSSLLAGSRGKLFIKMNMTGDPDRSDPLVGKAELFRHLVQNQYFFARYENHTISFSIYLVVATLNKGTNKDIKRVISYFYIPFETKWAI